MAVGYGKIPADKRMSDIIVPLQLLLIVQSIQIADLFRQMTVMLGQLVFASLELCDIAQPRGYIAPGLDRPIEMRVPSERSPASMSAYGRRIAMRVALTLSALSREVKGQWNITTLRSSFQVRVSSMTLMQRSASFTTTAPATRLVERQRADARHLSH